MKRNLLVILAFALLFISNNTVISQTNVQLETKSVNKVLSQYSIPQKIKLHISLMKTYAKNQKWKYVIDHLKAIYTLCPDLKGLEVIVPSEEDYSNSVFISPRVIKEIQQLGIKNVNTQKEFFAFLELFIPLCKENCKFEKQELPANEPVEETN